MAGAVVLELLRRGTLQVGCSRLRLRKAPIMRSVDPASTTAMLSNASPRLWQAYLNIAIGCRRGRRAPCGFSAVQETAAPPAPYEEEAVHLVDLREVQRGRRLALLEGPKPCDGADWATCTEPSSRPAIAEAPGAATSAGNAVPRVRENRRRWRR